MKKSVEEINDLAKTNMKICANCGGHIFETNTILSILEGHIVWSHLEDTKCDDPEEEK